MRFSIVYADVVCAVTVGAVRTVVLERPGLVSCRSNLSVLAPAGRRQPLVARKVHRGKYQRVVCS